MYIIFSHTHSTHKYMFNPDGPDENKDRVSSQKRYPETHTHTHFKLTEFCIWLCDGKRSQWEKQRQVGNCDDKTNVSRLYGFPALLFIRIICVWCFLGFGRLWRQNVYQRRRRRWVLFIYYINAGALAAAKAKMSNRSAGIMEWIPYIYAYTYIAYICCVYASAWVYVYARLFIQCFTAYGKGIVAIRNMCRETII